MFNPKCGQLSDDRKVASAKGNDEGSFAYSSDQIPIGAQFSVKILERGSFYLLAIGVTTNDPDTGPLPEGWADMDNTDQYWHVAIGSGHCTAWHKGGVKQLSWDLHDLPSNTFGCRVMKGKLHLYHNGIDMGVVFEGLPTNKPLWGFVRLRGGWKVEGIFVTPKEWLSAYEDSIRKHGSISVEVTRTILVGPSAAGKSTLKHLLVHNAPKAVKMSTPVMETPEVITKRSAMDFSSEQYAVQEATWQPINGNIMKNSLHAIITSKAYQEKNQYPAEVEAMEAKDGRHKAKNTNEQDQSNPTENGQPEATTEAQSGGHPPPYLPQSDLASLDVQYSQLLQEMGGEGETIRLRDASFIHLLDTGGQPSFQDVLPLLLDVPCTYIQVFNASHSLYEQMPITYRPNDHTVVRLDGSENGCDMMLHSFSSMQTMSQKCAKELASFLRKDRPSPQLRIFVVGTHKDELIKQGRLEEASKEVETFLKKLDGKPYYKSIQWDSVEGKHFFLINAMAVNERAINDLRERISSEGSLGLDVPVMWFLCQEVTRCTPRKFFRLRDLEAFCRKHGFVDGENAASQFHALLQLLTLLGFYSFFNLEDVLDEDNFVCTDRGVFLKEVSTLLAVQFKVPTSAEMESFKETGILVFSQKIFKELGICQEIDAQWFLKALQHLGIAAQVHSRNGFQEYFIPAVLPLSLSIQDPVASVAPLCLTYKIKGGTASSYTYMPQGVFCRFAVELIRQGWNIIVKTVA